MESKFLIKEIKKNNANKSMFVIIDARSGFEEGQYVKIVRVL